MCRVGSYMVAKKSKRISDLYKNVDLSKKYSLEDAVVLLQQLSKVKFVEMLDIAVHLGVNTQHSDQVVRSVISLPHGVGKTYKVAVFARDAKAKEAESAGADIVGAEDLVDKILSGDVSFDRCVATPDVMVLLGRVAKILGPKGLMPNAKLGTVTMDVKKAVHLAKSGQEEFRAEKSGIVHAGVGKLNFELVKLVENVKSFLLAVNGAKPSGVKGAYFLKAYLSSTMGCALQLDLSDLL